MHVMVVGCLRLIKSFKSFANLKFFVHFYAFTVSKKALCFRSVRPPHSFIRTLLARYLMNDFNNFDKTYREYSLAATDDTIRFWR